VSDAGMEGDGRGGYQFRRQHENAMMRRMVRLWWYKGECNKEVLREKSERGMAQRGALSWIDSGRGITAVGRLEVKASFD
jgi:hypothetical protein